MKTKQILNNLLLYFIFLVIFIVSILLTAGLVAYIASLITENTETIITICLISIWLVMIVLYIIRSRFLYKKRVISMDTNDDITLSKEKKRLKAKYISSIILSAILSGVILYNLKPTLLSNVNGGDKSDQSIPINDSTILTLKISIVVILLGFWIYRKIMIRNVPKSGT